ncbi:Ger(x)C family spore germination protein [Halobacillus karajensis]|uniref:Germination protein, Ger(X)C family n=1 Tax=Halobacillus karajensis TaxID=195088 RepID=A0A024P7Z2_9BACI|nr:Ger(x)C family spore germination protein [Halobacillus karajensis]CDQ21180.1 germination protein, Ger(x)C family [Halobacillus karajensis]CDQ24756.1 germination protein, Ger(x)C family [Halobacillus karajensis]CDQ28884.1 germination protein, Ger(x)C family [Halobacillus karajensis]
MRKVLCVFSVILLLLAGCLPKSYIETLGIISAVGYDLTEGERIRGTLVMFQFDPAETSTSQVVTAEAETSKGVRFATGRLTSHELVSGQVRLEIFENELAERGMLKYMDTLQRDATISDMGYLATSEVPTERLLKSKNDEDQPNTGDYIQELIKKSIKNESIPSALLTTFMHDVYDVGKDPILPLLSLENDKTVINGVSLFQDDRLVQTVSQDLMFYIMLMTHEFEHGQFQIQLEDEALKKYHKKESIETPAEGPLHVSVHELSTKPKIRPTKGEPTKQSLSLEMEGRLLEITQDIDLKNKNAVKTLEKEMEKKVTEHLNETLKILKENAIDPVGFGAKYNAHNRSNRVTRENWREQIQDLQVKFDVSFTLLRYGISE